MEKYKEIIIAVIVCATVAFIGNKALDKDIKDIDILCNLQEGFHFNGSFYKQDYFSVFPLLIF